jgi:hypothetical protein
MEMEFYVVRNLVNFFYPLSISDCSSDRKFIYIKKSFVPQQKEKENAIWWIQISEN